MMAVGETYALHADRLAPRGRALMPLLDKANSPANAICELADTFEPPSVALLEFGPHHLAGSITDPLVAPRLSYLHVDCPRSPSSLFVAESEIGTERFSDQGKSFRHPENQSGGEKADVYG